MRRFITTVLVSATLLGGVAVAADPVVGSWTLDVAKSKFSPGPAPKSGTRVYSESADGQTLEGKTVGASGKETSIRVTYKANGTSPVPNSPDQDAVTTKRIDARTWDFTLTKAGKVVGTIHRVVSADGKTLMVHNKGTWADGVAYDDTLVYTR